MRQGLADVGVAGTIADEHIMRIAHDVLAPPAPLPSCGSLMPPALLPLTSRKPTRSTGPRGQVDDKIWVPVVDGPPVTVVRRSPPSLTLARDAVEEQARVRKRTRPVDKA